MSEEPRSRADGAPDDPDVAAYDLEPRPPEADDGASGGAWTAEGSLADGSDDRCPKCDAPLSGEDALLCLRCGYDLRTNQVHVPVASDVEVAEDAGESADAAHDPFARIRAWMRPRPGASSLEPGPPLPRALPGGERGALVLLLLALLVLVGAALAGAAGLYPVPESADGAPGVASRLETAARLLGLVLAWSIATGGTLLVFAKLGDRDAGAPGGFLVRVATAVVLAGLVAAPGLRTPVLGWTIETLLQGGVLVVALMVGFRLRARAALPIVLTSGLAMLLLAMGVELLHWTLHG